MLGPDLYYRSVHDIDLDLLARQGVTHLFVDVDNTLLPRDAEEVPVELREWVAGVVSRGFTFCLVSNNWHDTVHTVAAILDVPIVAKAIKPLPFAFMVALKRVGGSRRNSAVVGDQVFTDVLGGKLLGMRTVMVQPLSHTDLPHTLMLRHLERLVMADRRPLP